MLIVGQSSSSPLANKSSINPKASLMNPSGVRRADRLERHGGMETVSTATGLHAKWFVLYTAECGKETEVPVESLSMAAGLP